MAGVQDVVWGGGGVRALGLPTNMRRPLGNAWTLSLSFSKLPFVSILVDWRRASQDSQVVDVHVEELDRLEHARLGVLEEEGWGPVVGVIVGDLCGGARGGERIVIGHGHLEGISTLNVVYVTTGCSGVDNRVHATGGQGLAVESQDGKRSGLGRGGNEGGEGSLCETHLGWIFS